MGCKSLTRTLVLFVIGSWALPAGAEAILFQDTFDRGSTASPLLLNGSVPDVRPNQEAWIAPTAGTWLFQTTGSTLTTGLGKAYLPFTPSVPGVYTLQVTADPADSGVYNDWISMGFAPEMVGEPYQTVGPWMLIGGEGTIKTALDGTGGIQTWGTNLGTGAHVLTIELDTTPALWKVEWFVDDSSVRTYTYPTANPTINYVQLGCNTAATTMGTFDNFTLSFVPEPSTWLVLFSGILVSAIRRRRRER